jgi:RHS repeat-associated protein
MDRLITATVTAGTAGYGYDHDGRRVKQTVGVTITNYQWDEVSAYGDVILETDGNNLVKTAYILGGVTPIIASCSTCDICHSPLPISGQIISQVRDSIVSYHHFDGQDNTRFLTDESGNIRTGERYVYSAYGVLESNQTNSSSNYLYVAQQNDQFSTLYSLRARYYNPASGQFLSRDTENVDIRNPIELNRYGYARNNPINYYDPSGLLGIETGAIVRGFLITGAWATALWAGSIIFQKFLSERRSH